MANKITARHIKFVAWTILAGAAASAASYVVPSAAPVYDGGKLIDTGTFAAHLNGWPLPYVHNACYGPNVTCQSYLDWWGFVLNTLVWAVVALVGWYGYKRLAHRRRRPAGSRK